MNPVQWIIFLIFSGLSTTVVQAEVMCYFDGKERICLPVSGGNGGCGSNEECGRNDRWWLWDYKRGFPEVGVMEELMIETPRLQQIRISDNLPDS